MDIHFYDGWDFEDWEFCKLMTEQAQEYQKEEEIEESWEEYTANNFPTVEDLFRRENMQYDAMYLDTTLMGSKQYKL